MALKKEKKKEEKTKKWRLRVWREKNLVVILAKCPKINYSSLEEIAQRIVPHLNKTGVFILWELKDLRRQDHGDFLVSKLEGSVSPWLPLWRVTGFQWNDGRRQSESQGPKYLTLHGGEMLWRKTWKNWLQEISHSGVPAVAQHVKDTTLPSWGFRFDSWSPSMA